MLVTFATESVWAAESGLDNAPPIGGFLNGVFPETTPHANGDWALENAFPHLTFTDPIQMLPVPGTRRLMVAEKIGRLVVFENAEYATAKTTLLDLSSNVESYDDSGLLGFAFHPEFGNPGSANEHFLYVYYRYTPDASVTTSAYCRLSRFTWNRASNAIDPATEFVLINQFDRNNWHNGGGILFGNDGLLYLSSGDEGAGYDVLNSAQRISNGFFSGILRIDVDQRGGDISHPIRRQPLDPATPPPGWPGSYSQGYYVPNDNPWVDPHGGNLEEFWAIGVRSPHRMTIDPPTGEIYFGDVGQETREELNLLSRGANYQWPYREGLWRTFKPRPAPIIGLEQAPLLDYGRGEGGCIIGGYVYRGTAHADSLAGKYIFGDHNSGRIWSLDRSGGGLVREELVTLQRHGPGPNNGLSGFGLDADNELYLLSLAGTDQDGGIIYKLARTGGNIPEPPLTLSATGAFSDLNTLTPAPGLIPYTVNAPLWTDGASKQRWLAIPNDGTPDSAAEQIAFSQTGNWSFPVGTVLVKQFDLNGRRMETRFLVHGQDGHYYGVTYKWREDQSDADLLFTREEEVFNIGGQDYTWTFPSRSDCLQCHTDSVGRVVGVRTHQLNGDHYYPATGRTANQLVTLNRLGFFAGGIDEGQLVNQITAKHISDTGASLEERARSYLDSNCAHCHNPVEGIRQFDMRLTTPLDQAQLIGAIVQNDFGIVGAREIVPQDPGRSMAYVRQNTTDVSLRMPPLGRHLIDTEAVGVLADWINTLPELERSSIGELDIERQSNGSIEIQLFGMPFATYHLQSVDALNATNWQTIQQVITDQDGTGQVEDNSAGNARTRIYRAVWDDPRSESR